MKQISMVKTVLKLALISVVGLLVACSSSSDSGVVSTTGYVVAAPVSGASVLVKDSTGINTIAGPVTTASDGGYTLDPGSARSGTFILESSGGTYKDEATGEITNAGMLKAYIDGANLAAGSQMHLTPASTIVHGMVVDHGVALTDALTAFKDTFGFDADSTVVPADATNPAADATNEELLAGLRVAVFSQLTKNLSLAPSEQFDLLKALAEDLAYGDLDGEGDAGVDIAVTANVKLPVDIHNRFSQALVDFHAKTVLDNDVIGVVPFAKVALTKAYKIEYLSETDAMVGKTEFTLRIANIGGGAANGLTVDLVPMMHMPEDGSHTTPMIDCIESIGTGGDYDCKLYYLMPSGDPKGYWTLAVTPVSGGESATFFPQVMMIMGTKVVLIDPDDGDAATMEHKYILFKESLAKTEDGHDFTMFVATMESMMNIPAVPDMYNGMLVVVQVSTVDVPADGDWIDADGSSGDGYWSAAITGLTDKIHVRLFIDGIQKTNDGLALDGANGYTTFMIGM